MLYGDTRKSAVEIRRGNNEKRLIVDTRGEKCPKPLLKTRDAIRKAPRGAVIEVLGTHAPSKKEVQLAAKAVGARVLAVEEEGGFWKVVFQLPPPNESESL